MSIDVAERAGLRLLGDKRRELTLSMIRQNGFVRVSDLVTAFGVSEATVRADLNALGGRGVLRRVHGGAVPAGHGVRTAGVRGSTRLTDAAEKMAIGEAAAGLVRDGESIILDVGTTTTLIAHALVARRDLSELTVFTNSLNVAVALEPALARFAVVVTGGTLRPARHSLVEPIGGAMLDGISADTVFLSCGGVNAVTGVTTADMSEAMAKRRMVATAARVVVIAAGAKVGRIELAGVCGAEDVGVLITGPSADEGELAALGGAGVACCVVGGSGAE